jgi:hypothetical protein
MLADFDKWYKLQKPICDKLWFEGCTHGVYRPETDGLAGCFLEWKCELYTVHFDIEDAESFEDLDYLCVEIREPGEDDALYEGLVAGIEDVKAICALVAAGKLDEAQALLGDWDDLEQKVTSKDMAELHRRENWNRQENRPKTEEEKRRDYQAYVAEWAAIDREVMPGILGFLSVLENNTNTRDGDV